MSTAYQEWPFRTDHDRYPDERARWWAECYIRGAVDRELSDVAGWTVITGGPGSGKSVALAAWLRREEPRAIIVDYPPERWPGAEAAWLAGDPRPLSQMLVAAGRAFYDVLEASPHKAKLLDDLQRSVFRALIERIGPIGRRHYLQLTARLGDERAAYEAVEVPDDLRDPPLNRRDLELQVRDVVWVAQALGAARIVFTFDLSGDDSALGDGLRELFSGLDVLANRQFVVVAAVPEELLAERRLVAGARGRVAAVFPNWDEGDCRLIAARHLCVALDREPDELTLADFATPDVLAAAARVIVEQYERPAPAGWVHLAETLLYLTHRSGLSIRPPISDAGVVLRMFFARHMKLRLDRELRAVWRGPRLLRLDEQPYNFIALLHARGDERLNWDDDMLRSLAGTKGNVHTLAKRARLAIEPFHGRNQPPIYIVNDRGGGGYGLENAA